MDENEVKDIENVGMSMRAAAIAKLILEDVSADDATKHVDERFRIINADNTQVLNVENLCKQ